MRPWLRPCSASRNPAPIMTRFAPRPRRVAATYRPRNLATSEPMKRKVAMSVPKACTAPTRRSLPVISAQSAAPARREAHPPRTSSRVALVQQPSVRSVRTGRRECPSTSLCTGLRRAHSSTGA